MGRLLRFTAFAVAWRCVAAQDLFEFAPPADRSLRGKKKNNKKLLGGPPKGPLDYSGVELPAMVVQDTQAVHFFAIGDWGGLDGSLWENRWPPIGRHRLISYKGGHEHGPHPMPHRRWNHAHTEIICSTKQLVECFDSRGEPPCEQGCGFVKEVDLNPQMVVAEQFRAYAAEYRPQLVLNVGDNFYWGGIEKECGTPMSQISYEARHQFDQVFEGVYYGDGLAGVPWLSVLGNHDWGGWAFNNGWDQQIAYTWASDRWILPAPYYSQRVEFRGQGFSVEILMLDSNVFDTWEDPHEHPSNNICGEHNWGQRGGRSNATCAAVGGPGDVWQCPDFFRDLWRKGQSWAMERLAASTADWQFIVTHFPCGHESGWYRTLYADYGLDLLVTGHRHNQELWVPGHARFHELGGLTCFVTGGGGGITSEATPGHNDGSWYGEAQYGFYDIEITKANLTIQSIDYSGKVVKSAVVTPR